MKLRVAIALLSAILSIGLSGLTSFSAIAGDDATSDGSGTGGGSGTTDGGTGGSGTGGGSGSPQE
jgi:hypothetical protein